MTPTRSRRWLSPLWSSGAHGLGELRSSRLGKLAFAKTEPRACKTDTHRSEEIVIVTTELRKWKTDAHRLGEPAFDSMDLRVCKTDNH